METENSWENKEIFGGAENLDGKKKEEEEEEEERVVRRSDDKENDEEEGVVEDESEAKVDRVVASFDGGEGRVVVRVGGDVEKAGD